MENMEAPDGLLLQVTNGEQWSSRWKHTGDDAVRDDVIIPPTGGSQV